MTFHRVMLLVFCHPCSTFLVYMEYTNFNNWTHFLLQLLMKLKKLNGDPNIHGIIVQMPLDTDNAIDSHLITDAVCPEKDVDG